MQTNKKLINPEFITAVRQYKEAIKISKKNPDDKILKVNVNYLKYIIKSLVLKGFLNNGRY